ncbi:MAG: L-sorbose 1-phosphate reductase [Treponema sp. CETP13]|nr:MAG: L-sorbose 1-phosphate reductase [Treponema sp. CETP13]
MKTTAVRLYGKNDLRMETFDLPEIKDDEILLKVVADSMCMSTWKAVQAGKDHNRIPDNVAENPIIIGHELTGVLQKIGKKWESQFSAGQMVTMQPALNYKGSMASPGYSYKYCGGDATYIILPPEVMIVGALLPVKVDGYFKSALSEPYSCVIGAMHSFFRTSRQKHEHVLGMKAGGNLAILGGCGPMGLAALDYSLAADQHPAHVVVSDQDDKKIARAKLIFDPVAKERGIRLDIVNTKNKDDYEVLFEASDKKKYDDILVMLPIPAVLETADKLLAFNGCMNFFSGPIDTNLSAKVNFYDVHYYEKHIIGTTGGNNDDQKEALSLMEKNLIHPEALITHVGGLNSAAEATMNLPKIPGGKKLIYTHKKFPLISLENLPELSENSSFLKGLAEIVTANNGLWSPEAEQYVLANAPSID